MSSKLSGLPITTSVSSARSTSSGWGVASEPDFVDAAVIFGTGFAPFRGGPLAYARSRGIPEVVARLTGSSIHSITRSLRATSRSFTSCGR